MAGREGSHTVALPDRWLSTLFPASAQGFRVVKADGAYVWDDEGTRYLDLATNGGVNILGHAHPQFTSALAAQVAELASAHPDVEHDTRDEFLEALSVVIPAPLSKVVMTNSGSEAVDTAVRVACAATRRRRIVAMERGYHGVTFLASLLSDMSARLSGLGPSTEIVRVPFDDVDAVDRVLDDSVAAVIVEPLQWQGGVRVARDSYLDSVQQLCQRRGALLIVDEVQTALRNWPPLISSHRRVVPDILCLGPSIGNGFPIGVTVMVESVAARGGTAASSSTVAGNPLACIAATVTLRTVATPTMRIRIADSGAHLQARLAALRMREIREVRGEGTMAGVDLHSSAPSIVRALRGAGVLVSPAPAGVIRLLPPVTIERRQIDFAVERLAAAIVELRDSRRRRRLDESDVELRGVSSRRPARSA